MDIIFKPLGWVLELCSKIVGGNYLFAILIFAVFVEIVLLPFGISQQKKSIKQARLRPKEQAIRKNKNCEKIVSANYFTAKLKYPAKRLKYNIHI